MALRKGQVFIVAAVVLSSIIILASFSFQQVVFTDSEDSSIQFYYQNALERQAEVFNSEISDNYTEENLRKGFYSFNSFVDRQSESKSIDYSAFQILILPEKNETAIINYRDKSTDFSYYNGLWTNSSLDPYQYQKVDGVIDAQRAVVEDIGIDREINGFKPRLLAHMEMKSESETWRNTILR